VLVPGLLAAVPASSGFSLRLACGGSRGLAWRHPGPVSDQPTVSRYQATSQGRKLPMS